MSMEANTMELNAAHALLLLKYGPSRARLEIEGPATLFINCVPTPQTTSTTTLKSPPRAVTPTSTPESACNISFQDNKSETNSSSFQGCSSHYTRNHLSGNNTREETQKDGDNSSLISELYGTIASLQHQIKEIMDRSPSPVVGELDPDLTTDILKNRQCNQQTYSHAHKRKCPKSSYSSYNKANNSDHIHHSHASDEECKLEASSSSKQTKKDMLKPKGNNMVPIGEGYALVPATLLNEMDWSPSKYTATTRKLLVAVFSRRVLATHSLTGKSSPAFPDKPAKKRLDPNIVNDIVQHVVQRTGVSASVVRTCITTKCADESKMSRNGQKTKN